MFAALPVSSNNGLLALRPNNTIGDDFMLFLATEQFERFESIIAFASNSNHSQLALRRTHSSPNISLPPFQHKTLVRTKSCSNLIPCSILLDLTKSITVTKHVAKGIVVCFPKLPHHVVGLQIKFTCTNGQRHQVGVELCKNRRAFICREGLDLVDLFWVWALQSMQHRVALWAIVWEFSTLVETQCLDSYAAFSKLMDYANEHSNAQVAILFVCCSFVLFNSKRNSSSSGLRQLDLSMLSLDAKIMESAKQVLLGTQQQLDEKHTSRVFRQGLLELIHLDSNSYPVCSFASIRCGIWLDALYSHAVNKELTMLSRLRMSTSAVVPELDKNTALLNRIESLPQTSTFDQLGEAISAILKDIHRAQATTAKRRYEFNQLLDALELCHATATTEEEGADVHGWLQQSANQTLMVVQHLKRRAIALEHATETSIPCKINLQGVYFTEQQQQVGFTTMTKIHPLVAATDKQCEVYQYQQQQVATFCLQEENMLVCVALISPHKLYLHNRTTGASRTIHVSEIRGFFKHPVAITAISTSCSNAKHLLFCFQCATTSSSTANKMETYVARLSMETFASEFAFVKTVLPFALAFPLDRHNSQLRIAEFQNGSTLVAPQAAGIVYIYPFSPHRSIHDFTVKPIVVNPKGGSTFDCDGTYDKAQLSSSIGCMCHDAETDTIVFSTSKNTTSIRRIASNGTINTLLEWRPDFFGNLLRVTALWVKPHNHNLFAVLLQGDRTSVVRKFEYTQTDCQHVPTSTETMATLPCQVTFAPDRASGLYFAILDNGEKLGFTSSGVVESTITQEWSRELIAWEAAFWDFQLYSRAAIDSMVQLEHDMVHIQNEQVLPRMDTKLSESLWRTMSQHTNADLSKYIDFFLPCCPCVADVVKLWNCCCMCEQARHVQSKVNAWLEAYTWPARLMKRDINALIQLVRDGAIHSKTIASVFDSRSFVPKFELGIDLLEAALQSSNNGDEDVFRLPAVHWINRIDEKSVAPRPLPTFALLKRAFTYWESNAVIANKSTVVDWLVAAHFKTICARKVSSLRALVHLDLAISQASRVHNIVFGSNKLTYVFGETLQAPLGQIMKSAVLDKLGVVSMNVWFQAPAYEFLANGALPISQTPHLSGVLLEPVFSEICSTGEAAQNGAVFECTGTFEAAANGTYLFAWASNEGTSSAHGLMYINPSVTQGNSEELKQTKLNQWIAFSLTEGEHVFNMRAFAKVMDARLVIEGPYTPVAAKRRVEMPSSSKKLPYPLVSLCATSEHSPQQRYAMNSVSSRIVSALLLQHAKQVLDNITKRGEASTGACVSVLDPTRHISANRLVDEILDLGGETCQTLLVHFDYNSHDGDELAMMISRLQAGFRVMLDMLVNAELTGMQIERIAAVKAAIANSMAQGKISAQEICRMVDEAVNESQASQKHLDRIHRVLATTASLSSNDQDTIRFKKWVDNTLRVIKRIKFSEARCLIKVDLAPTFRMDGGDGLKLMEQYHENAVFSHLWALTANTKGEEGLVGQHLGERIEQIRAEQARIRASVVTLTLTWGELEVLAMHKFMDKQSEAVRDFLQVSHDNIHKLADFHLIWLISRHWQVAQQSLNQLQELVDSGQAKLHQQAVDMLQLCGEELDTLAAMGKLSTLDLESISALAMRYNCHALVHPVVFTLQAQLPAALLADSLALFLWMRKTPNDQEFASLIEMSFTKPELEIPHELWCNEKGSVDEEILSFLADVRATLHPLVFAESLPLETFASLFRALHACNWRPGSISLQLERVNGKRRALMQLLYGEEQSNTESHNQLLFLQSKQADWVCTSTVTMQYLIDSKVKTLDRELLADLQSTLVLGSENKHEDDFVSDLSSSFVEELCFLDLVCECAKKLARVGHLCFVKFELRLQFGEHTDLLRSAAQMLEVLVDEWTDAFYAFHCKFPLMCSFTNRQIVTMVLVLSNERIPSAMDICHLPTRSMQQHRHKLEGGRDAQAIDLLKCRDPDSPVDAKLIWDLYKRTFTKQKELSPEQALMEFGSAFTLALEHYAPLVSARMMMSKLGLALPRTISQVKVLRTASQAKLADAALTAYASIGRFPTRNDCLFVSEYVSVDSALNLARRWAASGEDGLFCLIAANQLSFDDQRTVGRFLESVQQRRIRSSSSPFLIVVSEECAIESMFNATGRISQALLGVEELRAYVCEALQQRHVTATTFASQIPGQGKTFTIRQLAHPESLHVFRINALNHPSILIDLCSTDKCCIHIEISDSACRSSALLTAILFDYVLLNGLIDDTTSKSFIWRGPRRIFIELPSGVSNKLRIAKLFDFRMIDPNEDMFVADLEGLQIGMGEQDFYSARCDGTVQV